MDIAKLPDRRIHAGAEDGAIAKQRQTIPGAAQAVHEAAQLRMQVEFLPAPKDQKSTVPEASA